MPTGKPGRTHGSVGTYIAGCRCDDCRLAASRYYHKQTFEERYAIPPEHGTETRYTSKRYLCRCAECKEASRLARARRRAGVAA